MGYKKFGWILGVAVIGVSVSGCTTGKLLRARSDEIQEIVDRIHPRAYVCAPKELAIAESNVTFGRYELDQGDFVRARTHLDNAEMAATKADRESKDPLCVSGLATEPVEVEVVAAVPVAPKLTPKPKDRDGDGYLDDEDGCPDQAEDFDGFADDDGCPDLDNDQDGVFDVKDKCPNVAEDLDGFEDDDGCPDLDNDQDGLPDLEDKCPNEAEDFDGFEDEDGCPDPDNDQDGVIDLNDQCPNEPEIYNGYKDGDGCPDKDPLAKIEGDTIKLNQKVFFKTGKSTILSQSFPLLNDVAEILMENPTIKIRIEGHTDSRGSDRKNLRLSEQRAKAVNDYLAEQGVDRERMEAVGYGEERPIDDNNSKEGRANNRRVEIHITSR